MTGEPLGDLRPVAGKWSRSMASTRLSCVLPGVVARGLLAQIVPWRHYLAVEQGGQVQAAGPIFTDSWSQDDGTVTLNAAGAEAYLARRTVLPPRVAQPPYDWRLYDEAEQTPAHWARTIVGLSGGDPRTLPGVVAWVITQAVGWPDVPAIEGVDNWDPGDRTLWVEGIDLRSVTEVIDDVTRQAGAEWDLVPEWDAARSRLGWKILVGDPEVRGHRSPAWSERTVTGLEVVRDGSRLVTHQHVTGGGDAGVPMSVTEVQPGPVMLEAVDSTRRTESDPARLRGWARSGLVADRYPWLTVSFDAPTRDAHLWSLGDAGTLTLDAPHLPAVAEVRVASISGEVGADMIRVQCHPIQGGG